MSWNVLHIKVDKMIMRFMFNHQLQVVKFWKVSQKPDLLIPHSEEVLPSDWS